MGGLRRYRPGEGQGSDQTIVCVARSYLVTPAQAGGHGVMGREAQVGPRLRGDDRERREDWLFSSYRRERDA